MTNAQSQIGVLFVIDDDEAVRDSIQLRLQSEGCPAQAFATAEDALARLEGGDRPHCIVSDVRLPSMSGLEFQSRLVQLGLSIPVILITGHGQVQMAVRALKAGVYDFLEKPFEWSQLMASVRGAMGEAMKVDKLLGSLRDIEARRAQLSDRQREVMDLAVLGFSNKEIALELDIGPRTVESYRASVMEKLGAANLAELVRMAVLLEKNSTH